MSAAIPWILMAWTVCTMVLLAERHRVGFMSGLASQALWLVFDWQVGAYGLMPLAVILGSVYVRGYVKWGRG